MKTMIEQTREYLDKIWSNIDAGRYEDNIEIGGRCSEEDTSSTVQRFDQTVSHLMTRIDELEYCSNLRQKHKRLLYRDEDGKLQTEDIVYWGGDDW